MRRVNPIRPRLTPGRLCGAALVAALISSATMGFADLILVGGGPDAGAPAPGSAMAVQAQKDGDRLLRAGNVAAAAQAYQRAARSAPDEPIYQITAGVALASAGRMDDALAAFQRAQLLTGSGDKVVDLLLKGAAAERIEVASASVNTDGQGTRTSINAQGTQSFGGFGGGGMGNGGGAGRRGSVMAAAPAAGQSGEAFAYSAPRVAPVPLYGMDTGASLKRLQSAAARFPDSPVLLLLLGDANQLAMRWTDADAQYHKAIELAPKWAKPRVNLGLSLLAQGRAPEAIRMFQSALALDPGDTQAQLGKGDAELRSGRSSDALTTYNNVARSQNNQVAAQAATGIGEVYARNGNYRDAVESFQRAKNLDPTDPAPAAAMGEAQFRAGDYTGAASSYREALYLSRNGLLASQAVLYRALTEAQLSAHDTDGAIVTLRQAVAVEPNSGPLWHRLWAQALYLKSDSAGGDTELKAALEAEGNRYSTLTMSALDAHHLISRFTTEYAAALNGARTSADRQRILRALSHLARFQKDGASEAQWRLLLVQSHPSGPEWYALAETYDLRANDPANARDAYTRALSFGDLPDTAKRQARARIAALAKGESAPVGSGAAAKQR